MFSSSFTMSKQEHRHTVLLRPANYSDTAPGPKTRPNVIIRIFELSLYYAGLNSTPRVRHPPELSRR